MSICFAVHFTGQNLDDLSIMMLGAVRMQAGGNSRMRLVRFWSPSLPPYLEVSFFADVTWFAHEYKKGRPFQSFASQPDLPANLHLHNAILQSLQLLSLGTETGYTQ